MEDAIWLKILPPSSSGFGCKLLNLGSPLLKLLFTHVTFLAGHTDLVLTLVNTISATCVSKHLQMLL